MYDKRDGVYEKDDVPSVAVDFRRVTRTRVRDKFNVELRVRVG